MIIIILNIMKRIVLLALILFACACEKQDTGYVFHDDFFIATEGTRYELDICPQNYFLIIKEKDKNAVMNSLTEKGFEVTTEPYKWMCYTSEEYEVPEVLRNCIAFTVKGEGYISSIPRVVYSNYMYTNEAGDMIGRTNTFLIKFTKNRKDEQLINVNKYAKEHGFLLLGEASRDYFRIACTNSTSANCVEMANWFIEEAGFKAAFPELADITIE